MCKYITTYPIYLYMMFQMPFIKTFTRRYSKKNSNVIMVWFDPMHSGYGAVLWKNVSRTMCYHNKDLSIKLCS